MSESVNTISSNQDQSIQDSLKDPNLNVSVMRREDSNALFDDARKKQLARLVPRLEKVEVRFILCKSPISYNVLECSEQLIVHNFSCFTFS